MQCKSGDHIQTGHIQFPKILPNNICRVIAMGDWEKCEDGEETYNALMKKTNEIDAIVFLGDMAYNLNKNNGEKGNEFLAFAQGLISTIPFQVSYHY